MHEQKIRSLMQQVQTGEIDIEKAISHFKNLPYEDIGYAMVDHHRHLRTGCPETIFSQGKTIAQILGIAEKMLDQELNIMATRADHAIYEALKTLGKPVEFYETARIVVVRIREMERTEGTILVLSAGTSDIPIAEEAAVTAETMGNSVQRLYDVGVAGIHRLLSQKEKIDGATVLIVVAGMDGALPSVVAGLTDKPVIAVPTSVGYGASFGGLAALLTMLNSCANGVTVVNIDNGYGAGYSASIINRLAERNRIPNS
jgi:hypothetical protein